MRIIITLFTIFFLFPHAVSAQKFLQIERKGSARTKKIPLNTELTYRILGDDYWYTNTTRDYLTDVDLIAFEDRFVNINDIRSFKNERNWPTVAKTQTRNFGLAWSALALIGTLTDNDPETQYEWSDAIITAGCFGLSFTFEPLFKNKITKFGDKKRLRLVDLRFKDY
ncbi:MAG: hypothetical protein HRU40_01295 [Saprospiraceae bacterium]|nr:hypothetical protein [Saprospiraceae bacterium]